MTGDQWRRARDLFERALDRPSDDVEEWVVREAGDDAIAAEVNSLLQHHTRAGTFLEDGVVGRVAALLDEEARFAPSQQVGVYLVDREIGRGGMGRVYLATDTRLNRKVALKALGPALAGDLAQRERLKREARAAAALAHPGICTIYALEEIGDDLLIAAEYIEGHTLRDEIDSGRRPAPGELHDTVRQLAAALASAHARGITHRDLKPENVMRGADGALKILDFGLAVVDQAHGAAVDVPRMTSPGTLIGTPAYMAPEQLDGGVADARTDVFALGVLLYEYASGVHPFAAATPLATAARILEGDSAPLTALRPDLSPGLAQTIERCLRKRPSERFATAGDVVAALGQRGVAASAPDPAMSATWWRTHMAIVIALYFVAAIAGWLVKEWWQHGFAEAGFVLLAIACTVGGVLRGHLLFAQRTHDDRTFRRELHRSERVLMATDVAIAAVLFAEGIVTTRIRSVPGVLIIGLGLGIGLARLVLERSTTEAAFGGVAA